MINTLAQSFPYAVITLIAIFMIIFGFIVLTFYWAVWFHVVIWTRVVPFFDTGHDSSPSFGSGQRSGIFPNLAS